MMFELVDDTMTYAGNVPEIFSMRDHLYVAPTLEAAYELDADDDFTVLDDSLDLAVA